MIDLLKNHKQEIRINSNEKKAEVFSEINEKKYNDLEGLSLAKINFGLWYVTNRRKFILIIYFTLGIIGIITWSLFFYTFGHYVFVGIKEDKKLVTDLLNVNVPSHDFFLSRAPSDLMVEDFQNFKNISEDNYIFLVNLKNENKEYYSKFDYSLISGEEEIINGSSFIFPEKSKNLLISVEGLKHSPNNINFKINNHNWQLIKKHTYPDWNDFYAKHYNFDFINSEFIEGSGSNLSEKIKLNNLKFTANNNTAFNYTELELVIILKNNTKIVKTIKYIINNFLSGESRKIEIIVPGELAKVSNIDISAELDITKDNIYINYENRYK